MCESARFLWRKTRIFIAQRPLSKPNVWNSRSLALFITWYVCSLLLSLSRSLRSLGEFYDDGRRERRDTRAFDWIEFTLKMPSVWSFFVSLSVSWLLLHCHRERDSSNFIEYTHHSMRLNKTNSAIDLLVANTSLRLDLMESRQTRKVNPIPWRHVRCTLNAKLHRWPWVSHKWQCHANRKTRNRSGPTVGRQQ